MNITEKVKEEILIKDDDYAEEKREFLCALVKCTGSVGITGGKPYLLLESKNRLPVVTAAALIEELTGAETESGSGEGKGYFLRAEGAAAAKILSVVSEGRAVTDLGDTDGITSRSQAAAYARGVFLASGSAYVPSESVEEKSVGYHVEFIFFGEDAAAEFKKLLGRCALSVNMAKKGNYYSVYAKSAETVSDVLAFLGASDSVILINEISVTREMNGVANRKANCDLANIDKSVATSMRQVEAIERLKATGEYEKLDEKLRETCDARLRYRDATLGDLAKIMGISKSGLNHRLAKITALGEKKTDGRRKEDR